MGSGSKMGRLNSFRIQLDNPSGVYFGGNVVTGTVSLSLGGDGKKARGVRVELNGESNVHWTKRKGSGKNKRTVHIRSNEIFADKQIYLIGDAHNEMQIKAGLRVSFSVSAARKYS